MSDLLKELLEMLPLEPAVPYGRQSVLSAVMDGQRFGLLTPEEADDLTDEAIAIDREVALGLSRRRRLSEDRDDGTPRGQGPLTGRLDSGRYSEWED